MKSNKYLLVVLSILILFVFIASASAADSNGTDVLSVDESTSTVNEELALDYSSDNAESNDTNVLENDENNLLSSDNGGMGNVLKEGDVGKNNEIYGIAYAEDEGDSMSPVLGKGYYDIDLNFD